MKLLSNISFVILVYFYLLVPVFSLGGAIIHAGYLSLLLLFLFRFRYFTEVISSSNFVWFCLSLLPFVLWMSLFSIFSYQIAFGFHFYIVSVFIYVLFGMVLGCYLVEKKKGFSDTLTYVWKMVLVVIFVNSVVVILGFYNPEIRAFTESFLDLRSSNIDYAVRENRLRGLAGGGGANLSVMHGVSLVLALGLYLKNRLSTMIFCIFFSVTTFSIFFIGRTGLLLAGAGCLLLLTISLKEQNRYLWFRLIIFSVVVFIFSIFGLQYFRDSVTSGMFNYSIGFVLDGAEGISEEGTSTYLLNSISFPDNFLQLLVGIGEYTGKFSGQGAVDMGYMKTFTALGLPLALIFYSVVLSNLDWLSKTLSLEMCF